MTETQLRNQYIEKAKSYLGANEGSAKHTEIVDVYNTIKPLPVGYTLKYSDDWCAGFVSAMAQLCGLTDIIFPECGCTRMIDLYVAKGLWVENDAYIPKPGDLIMYDWQDSQTDADHVGIVTACNGSTITVIEGNKDNTVAYREISVNGTYIRGFCTPDYASKAGSSGDTSNAKKIWDYFMSKIGNEYGVAGLMGNLEAESNLCPYRVQGDFSSGYTTSKEYTAKVDSGSISKNDFVNNGPGGGGYGLAQWTFYTRKQGLYEMWKSGGYSSIGSLELACNYLWHELTTSYSGVVSVLKSATSVRVASDKVLHDFERPADQSASVEAKRESMGQAWYDKYHGSEPGGSEPDTPVVPDPPEPPEPDVKPYKKMSLLLMVAASRRSGL